MGRSPAGLGRITRWVGYVYAALGVVNILRVIGVLTGSIAGNDFYRTGVFDTLMLMGYQMVLVLMTFSLVLMVNGRLVADVRLQEEKFGKAFRSAPYALLSTRPEDGRILDVNEGFIRISGYSGDEAVGKTTQELQLWENEANRKTVVEV